MNERSTASYGALPLSVLKRMEEARDQFMAALWAGSKPKPEDYLPSDFSEDERERLLLNLKALAEEFARPRDERSTRQVMESSEATPPVQPDMTAGSSLPAKIGRYSIMARIEKGGMGIVYKAWHPVLDQPVALKTILPKYVRSSAVKDRLLDEARKVVKLKHPHIVSVYDADEEAGQPFFTMALVEGGSLAQRLAEFQLGTPRVDERGRPAGLSAQGWSRKQLRARREKLLLMMEKVCRAVHAAHANDPPIIHRDLKPGNILMEGDEPRVSDFGLAMVQAAQGDDPDRHDYSGTPPYMAPEQHRGATAEIGPATDVWALGVILYELCTGRLPFQGKDREQLSALVQSSEPPKANELNQGVDLNLAAVIQKCLKKKPKDRYSTVGLLADELSRCRRGDAVQARPETWREAGQRFARKHWLAALVGGTVILLLGMVSYLLSRPDSVKHDLSPNYVVSPNHQGVTARLQQTLRAGETVNLEDESGRILVLGVTNYDAPCTVTGSKGALQVEQLEGLSVLKVFSDPVCTHYEISAEMRQDDARAGGLVGVGVLGWDRSTTFGDEVALLTLAFSDKGRPVEPAADGSPCGMLALQLLRRIGKVPFAASVLDTRDCRILQTKDGWRRLRMQVNPERITFEVDGVEWQALKREDITPRARRDLFFEVDPQVVPPGSRFAKELEAFNEGIREFRFREVVTIFVAQSSASIRNLKITPSAK